MVSDSLRFSGRAGLVIWAALAVVAAQIAAPHLIERPFLVPLAIWGTVLGMLAARGASPAFRAFTREADLRPAILAHLVRIPYGAAFLWLAARGEMSPLFAHVAGPGDIVAGALALPAALLIARHRRFVLLWSALGLADILVVMATAARVLFSPERAGMAAFGHFPFDVLPWLVVPLIVLTHLWVLARLLTPR
jgi:hypothetical protein